MLRSLFSHCTRDAGLPACGLMALGSLLFACSLLWGLQAAAQGASATAERPARVAVSVPKASGGASVMLELSVRAARIPAEGNVGGAVRLRGSGGAVEVGRFSLFAGGRGEQRFQFNVTQAVQQLELSGSQAEVEVALVDRSGGPAPTGVTLTIGSAQIAVR